MDDVRNFQFVEQSDARVATVEYIADGLALAGDGEATIDASWLSDPIGWLSFRTKTKGTP